MSKRIHPYDEFLQSKMALAEYYSSIQHSCIVRTIGLFAGLFTVSQAVQENQLSTIFSSIDISLNFVINGIDVVQSLKFLLLFSVIGIFIFFILRSFLSYSLYSQYSLQVLHLNEDELKDLEKHDAYKNNVADFNLLQKIEATIAVKISEINPKLYFIIPASLMITNTSYTPWRKGYLYTGGLSMIFTILLLALLW